FQLGSPLFDKIRIKLNRDYYTGREIVIRTINNSPENIYVQRALLNGTAVDNWSVDRNRLMQGADLVLFMGQDPANR
ncbi:MAG: hypothetical protein E4G95_09400, partial [Bacteroidia bacterium]